MSGQNGGLGQVDAWGYQLLALASRPAEWIPRRSETIEILDLDAGRRVVSVDVDLDQVAQVCLPAPMTEFVALPIATLDRFRSHANFDVRDENGARLSRLNKEEERRLVFKGFLAHVQAMLGIDLDEDLRKAIWRVVLGRERSQDLVDVNEQLEAINLEPRLRSMLEDLGRLYYLVVLVPTPRPVPPGGSGGATARGSIASALDRPSRRVITYEFSAPLQSKAPETTHRTWSSGSAAPSKRGATDPTGADGAEATDTLGVPGQGGPIGTILGRLATQLGAALRGDVQRAWECEVLGAGECASYHVSLSAPSELRLGTSHLRANVSIGRTPGQEIKIYDKDRLGVEAHVFAQVGRPVSEASFSTQLYVQTHGLMRGALSSSILASVVMLIGLVLVAVQWRTGASPLEPSSGTTLMLLIPGVVATLVARPIASSITATVVTSTYVLLGITSAITFVAALSVSTRWDGVPNLVLWATLFALCAAVTYKVARQFQAATALAAAEPPTSLLDINPLAPTGASVP